MAWPYPHPDERDMRTGQRYGDSTRANDMFAPFRDDARTAALNRLASAIEKLVDHLSADKAA